MDLELIQYYLFEHVLVELVLLKTHTNDTYFILFFLVIMK